MRKRMFLVIIMLGWSVGLSGCATYAQQGALMGGLAGAAIGASHASHHRGGNTSRDVAIGAALGVALGVGVGNAMDQQYYSQMGYPPQMGRPVPMGYPQPQMRGGSPTYQNAKRDQEQRLARAQYQAYIRAEEARGRADAYGY